MNIDVLYFAALREAVGLDCEHIDVPAGVDSLQALRHWLAARGGAWAQQFAPDRRLMMSLNQAMARGDALLTEGDEVAFFPPVTGG